MNEELKKPNDFVRSISVSEARQLLGENNRPVFLILYPPDLSAVSGQAMQIAGSATCDAGAALTEDAALTDSVCMRERTLTNYLHQLGIPAHIRGYEYIKKAIEFALDDPSVLCAMTKELYPDVAKSCGSTSSRVERAIRHAIKTAWDRGSMQLQDDLFGTTVSSMRGRPTNGEFIAMLAEKLRLQQKQGSYIKSNTPGVTK